MPVKTFPIHTIKNWLVIVDHDDTRIEMVVEGFTQEGAVNGMRRHYVDCFNRQPRPDEILKVEETTSAPTEDSGASRS